MLFSPDGFKIRFTTPESLQAAGPVVSGHQTSAASSRSYWRCVVSVEMSMVTAGTQFRELMPTCTTVHFSSES